MSAVATPTLGPIGRLGYWSATHRKLVAVIWLVAAVGLGFFAPQAERALSGAGWEATGSQSVEARDVVAKEFQGLGGSAMMVVLTSKTETVDSPAYQQALSDVTKILESDKAVTTVMQPQPDMSLSEDRRTAVVQGGAALNPTEMVRAADRLKGDLATVGNGDITVALTGAPGMWSDFNAANKDAMLKSELYSWPVTLAILLLAFGSLVAAGLPLMLTIIGLMMTAGSLYLASQVFDVSIWAMNFAMMFALALGIDYALFVVVRFRAALMGSGMKPNDAVGVAMDTAGKAVLFSGVTVLISLSAVMLVPSPAFRSMALGIMLAVLFVLLATLTLLPIVMAKLGTRINAVALPWAHAGEHRSERFARWGEFLWKHPVLPGIAAVATLLALAIPVLDLRTGMPSIKVVPSGDSSRVGYETIQSTFGPGAPGALQVVTPTADVAAVSETLQNDPAIAAVMPGMPSADGALTLIQVVPRTDPSDPAVGTAIDRLRGELPADVLIGGAAAENHDLEVALGDATPIVIGIVLVLGFLLLLVALQAPLIAAIGVVTNLLAVGAAFGVAKLIFQDGYLTSLLRFEPQGFLDAWGPVFFFAMIFAISMDYTVFLLASAKEHYDRSHDPKEAAIGGLAHSGRVVFAAAAVMVAVFFTFAISGPIPPKEMGITLGVAVLLDALLIRLLLIPVALRLTGQAAWYLPKWLDRILPDVRFGH
ncbi:MAG: MMPL family transporter [Gaiellales bacterium]|jgi:putative drug exporter of the RND superfamily|nr:MMPL family transporter [Gaiellales bacterium]